MKKIVLITTLMLLAFSMSFAQEIFGFKAGVNFNNYTDGNVTPENLLGFNAGMVGMYSVHPLIKIQPELLYSQRGANYENLKTKEVLHYAELPIFLKLNLLDGNFNIQPYVGPEFRYLIKGQRTITVGSNDTTNDIDNLKKFDYGFGLGLDLMFNRNMLVGARYSKSLSEFHENFKTKHTSLQASFGYMF